MLNTVNNYKIKSSKYNYSIQNIEIRTMQQNKAKKI